MGIGIGKGENRMVEAAKQAISSPMLETSIDGARAVLINITGGPDTSHHRHQRGRAASSPRPPIPKPTSSSARASTRTSTDEVHITVIATGFEAPAQKPDPRVETAGYARAEERKPLLSDEEQVSPIFGTARTAVEPIINERPAQAAPQTQRPAAPQQNAPRPRAYQDEPDPRTRNRRGFTPDVPKLPAEKGLIDLKILQCQYHGSMVLALCL